MDVSTYIGEALVAIIATVVMGYAVPYVKANLTAKRFAYVTGWIDKAVKAAEQTIQGSGLGEKKKAYVIKILEQVGIVVDDTVDALIEAAVKVLNDSIDKATAAVVEAVTGT